MKETICTVLGLVFGYISSLFGGWDAAISTLVCFMAMDYITGLIVAGVFHKSGRRKVEPWKAALAGGASAARE